MDNVTFTENSFIPYIFKTSPHWDCKNWGVKMTPVGVNRGPHPQVLKLHPILNITPKSVKITTKGVRITTLGVELTQGRI